MDDHPKCSECDEPGPFRCHSITEDGDSFRGCVKHLCLAHVAGTADIHFNPGGWRKAAGAFAESAEQEQRP